MDEGKQAIGGFLSASISAGLTTPLSIATTRILMSSRQPASTRSTAAAAVPTAVATEAAATPVRGLGPASAWAATAATAASEAESDSAGGRLLARARPELGQHDAGPEHVVSSTTSPPSKEEEEMAAAAAALQERESSSMVAMLLRIYREEGVAGLFTGLVARVFQVLPPPPTSGPPPLPMTSRPPWQYSRGCTDALSFGVRGAHSWLRVCNHTHHNTQVGINQSLRFTGYQSARDTLTRSMLDQL